MNRKRPAAYVAGLFFLFAAGRATPATVMVNAAPGGVVFSPDSVMVQAGDIVMWTWKGGGHSVTSGDFPGSPAALTAFGAAGALVDPTLELHLENGVLSQDAGFDCSVLRFARQTSENYRSPHQIRGEDE